MARADSNAMDNDLDAISAQLEGGRDFEFPPLHLWHPELSGDIAIRIAADGTWYHDGEPIRRESLRNLFASILRKEDDGEFYLVTPVEKWRVSVELHPLIVTDIDLINDQFQLTLNTGKVVTAGAEYELFLDPAVDNVAAITLWHGLTAIFSRSAWYRLVSFADDKGMVSAGGISLQLV
ncbi:MAG: DUF1285 domain-containing protein [Halioglobus sp.]